MDIKAAVMFSTSEKFKIETLKLDSPYEDEVIVKMVATGICHTDLAARDQLFKTPLPAVLGHEGAGIVEKVGSQVTKVKKGDHVVLTWYSCGKCNNCLKGKFSYCLDFLPRNFNGARPDGSTTLKLRNKDIHGQFFCQSSFANYALVNQNNLVKVKKDISLDIIGPLGCGFQTGAGSVINCLKPVKENSIVIFGTGSVGISAIMAAVICECSIIIGVDINEERLKVAKELGASHTINASNSNVIDEVFKILPFGADFSLECVGNNNIARQAVDVLTNSGICGLVGLVASDVELSINMMGMVSGKIIRGISEGDSNPELFIPKLIEFYENGNFPIDKLIKFYPFENINEAVSDMEIGKVIKPILKF